MRAADTRDHFLRLPDEYRPDVAEFVRKRSSGRDPRPRLLRAPSKALRWIRERAGRRHMAKCIKVWSGRRWSNCDVDHDRALITALPKAAHVSCGSVNRLPMSPNTKYRA
jgi:hypothetical protein